MKFKSSRVSFLLPCCQECVILNRGETDGTSALRRKYSVLQSAKGHTLIQPDFLTIVLEKYEPLNLGESRLLIYRSYSIAEIQ